MPVLISFFDAISSKERKAAMRTSILVLVLVLGAIGGSFSNALSAGQIYWVERDSGLLRRANLDGTGGQTLVTGLGEPYDVALDVVAGKMYWVERFPGRIARANLNGSGIENLTPSGELSPLAIDLDLQQGKMYWTTASNQSQVRRANLDGTVVQTIYSGPVPAEHLEGIAVDAGGGKVYWTDSGDNDRVRRSNLDGSGVQTLVSGSEGIGIDHDLAHGKIYWADYGNGIRRSNLDGSVVELLVPTSLPFGLAVDAGGGKVYWSSGVSIKRANLNGTSVETIVTSDENIFGIDVDPEVATPVESTTWGRIKSQFDTRR